MEQKNVSWFRQNFYLIDLLKNLFSSKNIMAILYLVLNLCLIGAIGYLYYDGIFIGVPIFLALYLVIAFVALSPLGEVVLRSKAKCKRIKEDELLNRLEPLFFEVRDAALHKHPEMMIHPNAALYITDDPEPNAFALGRKTVCVTTGLLEFDDEEIKAVIGHELGHLSMHDTEMILLITVGNFIITTVANILILLTALFRIFIAVGLMFAGKFEGKAAYNLGSAIMSLITIVFINFLMFIWTNIGVWMVMKTSRNAEYEADAFSCDLGYTDGMLSFLGKLDSFEIPYENLGFWERKTEVFSILSDSHPATRKRIERIMKFTELSET